MMKPETLAMILAGGRVDDLNVLTANRPKSAVPFGGFARVIDFPLSNLMHSGLELAAILSQYRCYSLINHIGSGTAWDMVGRYRGISILPPFQGADKASWYKGSSDAVYQNLDFMEFHSPQEILILSGDHVYKMNYRTIIDYHRRKNADLTIAFKRVPKEGAHRFGIAEIDNEDGREGGRVLRYLEKPDHPEFNWASLTVYCFRAEILYEVLKKNAEEDRSFEFGRDIIPRLMFENKRVYGYKFDGYWGYTRTIQEYWQTSMDLLGSDPKIKLRDWKIRTNLEHRAVRDFQPLLVKPSAEITNSLVYNGCTVEGHVENSILFPGVHVEKGAIVRNSVLFFDNIVGEDATLEKVVSDVNVHIGDGCRIGAPGGDDDITVIGWRNTLPERTEIGPGAILHPSLPLEKLTGKIKAGEVIR